MRCASSSASSPRSGSASAAGSPAVVRPGDVQDIAIWAVPFGIVGARLYHVATDWERYFGDGENPVTALYVWRGGLGIWGGVALGAVGAYLGCRAKGIKFLPMADALAPGVLVAQAIGRWGNWFNQELYGRPTDLPWGLEIDSDHWPTECDYPKGSGHLHVRGRYDVPPHVPLRVPLEPGRVRPRDLARAPVPARLRPGDGGLRDGLHRRPRLDRVPPDRRRPARERATGSGSTSGPRSCCSSPQRSTSSSRPDGIPVVRSRSTATDAARSRTTRSLRGARVRHAEDGTDPPRTPIRRTNPATTTAAGKVSTDD